MGNYKMRMRIVALVSALILTAAPAHACDVMIGKYNQAKTVNFCLFVTDATVGAVKVESAAHASGDTYVMKDEGAEANTTNGFTDEGSCYSLVLTATEMTAARVTLNIEDQSTKTWADKCVVIETYGHASAEHALDLDTATVNPGTGGIVAASFGAGAIDAAAIAADAIGASEIATGAITSAEMDLTGSEFTAIPWNAAWDAEVQSEAADALVAYDPPTSAEMDARTLVAANYFDPAADTVAAVTTVTTATTCTNLTNLPSIPADWITAAGIANDAIGATEIADNAIDAATFAARGTAQSATGTTLVLAAAEAFADDELNGNTSLYIVSATAGAGQTRCITDYANATDTATVSAWTTTPTGTITYDLLSTPNCAATLTLGAGSIDSATFAAGAITASAIAADAIGASEMAADAIGASELGANSITSSEVADDAIDAGAIAADAIGASELATDAIGATEVAASAIGASEVATDAIGAAELAADAATENTTTLLATTIAELSAIPDMATPTVSNILRWMFQYGTGVYKSDTSVTEKTLYKNDGSTALAECTVADSGTVFTRGECAAP